MTLKFNPNDYIEVATTVDTTTIKVLIGDKMITIGRIDNFYDMYSSLKRDLLKAAEIRVNQEYTRQYMMAAAHIDKVDKVLMFKLNETNFPKQIRVVSSFTGLIVTFEPVNTVLSNGDVEYVPVNSNDTIWKVILTK